MRAAFFRLIYPLRAPAKARRAGTVTTCAYPGACVESGRSSPYGGMQAEIDNPAGTRIYGEGERTSVRRSRARVKVPANEDSA